MAKGSLTFVRKSPAGILGRCRSSHARIEDMRRWTIARILVENDLSTSQSKSVVLNVDANHATLLNKVELASIRARAPDFARSISGSSDVYVVALESLDVLVLATLLAALLQEWFDCIIARRWMWNGRAALSTAQRWVAHRGNRNEQNQA
jgi:hypothetical protein